MNSGLDLTIATIIGGILILLLINMNTRIADQTALAFTEGMPLVGANLLKSTFDNDLPKIGFGVLNRSNAILIADSNRLRFAYDSSKRGAYDSCAFEYSVVYPSFNRSRLTFSDGTPIRDSLPNPNEIFVYRSITKGGVTTSRLVSLGVTRLRFDYFDSNGNATTNTSIMKLISVTFRTECRFRIQRQGDTTGVLTPNAFPSLMVTKMYRPRNLQ